MTIGIMNPIKQILVQIQNKIMFRIILFKRSDELGIIPLERFGTAYGGWWIPKVATHSSEKKLLVSAGLGFDTSFDEALLKRDWYVVGIDPLKECCDRAHTRFHIFDNFKILNCGLSVEDGHQIFYQPKNLRHDSWSAINVQSVKNAKTLNFPVVSLKTLSSMFVTEFNSAFRYLKMDIEGAELALFQNSIKDFENFNILGIEMDFLALIPFRQFLLRARRVSLARKILLELESNGWTLVHVENANFFWVNLSWFGHEKL